MSYNMQQYDDGSWALVKWEDSKKVFQVSKTGHPTLLYPNNKATLEDDFFGDVLADYWSGGSGTDSDAVAPAINAQVNGVVRLVSGNAGGGDDSADASVLTAGLNWKANQGGLVMEARVNLPSIADVVCCVGFTDVLATTTVEMPFEVGASDAITSNAADAVCWVFDTGAATDEWHGVGVKSGTDTALVSPGSAPATSTWDKLRIEIDSSGNAEFFLNGDSAGSVANAVTATVALTPVVAVMTRTSASKNCDVDYVFCQQDR